MLEFKRIEEGSLMKKRAFTLAEVLITLGILGIVMEMTIPTLMQNMVEKNTTTMLKKEYSILSSAYTLAVQENGTPDQWSLGGYDDQQGALNILKNLSPTLKIIKNCGTDMGCWPDVMYKRLSNTNHENVDETTGRAKAQLADGSLIAVYVRDAGCAQPRGGSLALSNVCGGIEIDINGFKSPNKNGYDFFQFYLTKYGIVPLGTPQESDSFNSFATSCQDTTKTGWGCAAWVIYNENMDYLHCSNLSWSGPTKCQ